MDGAHGAQPFGVAGVVATDLDLHGAKAAPAGGRGLAAEVVGGGGRQQRVHGDGAGGWGGESRLTSEPVRQWRAARPREEIGQGGLDRDIGTGDAPGRGGQGGPRFSRREAHEGPADLGHADRKGGNAQPLAGEGRALAEPGAIGGLDADDEPFAPGEVARSGGDGFTQRDAPGPPAHACDGGRGGHGRRGNLAMSE